MSAHPPLTRDEREISDWLGPHLRWITVPSWLLSAFVHVGLAILLIVLAQTPSCRSDIAGDDGESIREVGIYVRENITPVEAPESPATEVIPEPDVAPPTPTVSAPGPAQPVPDAPPVALPVPVTPSPPVLGIGGPPEVPNLAASSVLRPSMDGGAAPPSTNGGPRATSFMGVSDAGRKFVYVIDRSFSMENYGALRAAKLELASSLERLDETQQFQIIFYNTKVLKLKPSTKRFEMFRGTDQQRSDARNQMSAVLPDGGTAHLPALLEALKMSPDVVFLLTDGATPGLTAADMAEIDRKNRSGARIHCIEFGEGPQLTDAAGRDPGNFLRKLAADHAGQYRYRDMKQLNPRSGN